MPIFTFVPRRNRHYNGAGVESLSPDNDVFVSLAHLYADNHKTMKQAEFCGDRFTDGITNGAHWYNVRGRDGRSCDKNT